MQEVVLGKALKVSNCRGKLPRKCKRTWYPNVSIHTLHAVLCIFTEVLTRRICQFNPIQSVLFELTRIQCIREGYNYYGT